MAAAIAPGPESETRQRLLESVKRRGRATVDELAVELGLSKTATRAHVLKLESLGLLERASVTAGGRGRPPLTVQISREQLLPLFPVSDGAVLTGLVAFLDANGHGTILDQFFDELWRQRREALDERLGTTPSRRRRLRVLNSYLEEAAYMPRIERDGSVATVVACHCPFPSAVQATRRPCRREATFMEYALDATLRRVRYKDEAEPHCRFEFDLAKREEG